MNEKPEEVALVPVGIVERLASAVDHLADAVGKLAEKLNGLPPPKLPPRQQDLPTPPPQRNGKMVPWQDFRYEVAIEMMRRNHCVNLSQLSERMGLSRMAVRGAFADANWSHKAKSALTQMHPDIFTDEGVYVEGVLPSKEETRKRRNAIGWAPIGRKMPARPDFFAP